MTAERPASRPIQPSALCERWVASSDEPPSIGARTTAPQTPWTKIGYRDQVSVTAIEAATDANASTSVGSRQRRNAGPRPTKRNGRAGITKRDPGDAPPYGSK